jgi:Berberine and berberine like
MHKQVDRKTRSQESDPLSASWSLGTQAYWGRNYHRLVEIKRKYDPDGLFFVHNGVGSEKWSADGFTKM